MTQKPRTIFHITHLDNLPGILQAGGLMPDSRMRGGGGPSASVGMEPIKRRRLSLPVTVHQGTTVGEYVPFYFCPRSIMLYLLHKGNHQDLAYRGGQGPILHLEADLMRAVDWADGAGRKWAFSLSNAGARYAVFYADLARLDRVSWDAVEAKGFTRPEVKEGKQAEFLVHGFFAWELVARVGVRDDGMREKVAALLEGAGCATPVETKPDWYF